MWILVVLLSLVRSITQEELAAWLKFEKSDSKPELLGLLHRVDLELKTLDQDFFSKEETAVGNSPYRSSGYQRYKSWARDRPRGTGPDAQMRNRRYSKQDSVGDFHPSDNPNMVAAKPHPQDNPNAMSFEEQLAQEETPPVEGAADAAGASNESKHVAGAKKAPKVKRKGCVCTNLMNDKKQGAADCRSIFEEKAWCYVNPGSCEDAQESTALPHQHWSFKACEHPCQCSGERNTLDQGGADCMSLFRGQKWCYVYPGFCADGIKSNSIKNPLQDWSFDACPSKCKCSGQKNSQNEGGPDCTTVYHGRQWCFTDPNVCPDSRRSRALRNQHWSYFACSNQPRPVPSGTCPSVGDCCAKTKSVSSTTTAAPEGMAVASVNSFDGNAVRTGLYFPARRLLAEGEAPAEGEGEAPAEPPAEGAPPADGAASPPAVEAKDIDVVFEIFRTVKHKIPVIFFPNSNPMNHQIMREFAQKLQIERVKLDSPPLWTELRMLKGDVWVVGQGLGAYGLSCMSIMNKAGKGSTAPAKELYSLVKHAAGESKIERVVFVVASGNIVARSFSKVTHMTAIGFNTQVTVNDHGYLAWLQKGPTVTAENVLDYMHREVTHCNGQAYTEIYKDGQCINCHTYG